MDPIDQRKIYLTTSLATTGAIAALTYFRPNVLINPETNYRGVALATVINTIALPIAHLYINTKICHHIKKGKSLERQLESEKAEKENSRRIHFKSARNYKKFKKKIESLKKEERKLWEGLEKLEQQQQKDYFGQVESEALKIINSIKKLEQDQRDIKAHKSMQERLEGSIEKKREELDQQTSAFSEQEKVKASLENGLISLSKENNILSDELADVGQKLKKRKKTIHKYLQVPSESNHLKSSVIRRTLDFHKRYYPMKDETRKETWKNVHQEYRDTVGLLQNDPGSIGRIYGRRHFH